MKHLSLIFLLLLFSVSGNAQGEYNVWCFGDSNLIDFNSGVPVQSLSSIKPGWPASTICDKNGSLLFYAQKDTIWDSSHNMMLNGDSIKGSNFLQSINILPYPCNDSLYYLFSMLQFNTGAFTQTISLYYSVININGNSGLGEVIAKNILLDSNLAAGLAMTRHGNNTDYWITYQQEDTNIYKSRQISNAGIGFPIISSLGLNNTLGGGSGSLEFSSNSSILINCDANNYNIQGFSFNNTTGVLSNNFTFILPSGLPIGYINYSQFSPDLTKLYISCSNWLIQYDFSSGNISTIVNSGIIIAQSPTYYSFFDIALAPDGKFIFQDHIMHI